MSAQTGSALSREGAVGLESVDGAFVDIEALGIMVQNFSQCRDVLLT